VSLGLAPCGTGYQLPPRFRSQVFSTSQRFQLVRVSRPCFVPQTVPGIPPSGLSPRSKRYTPLEAARSLAVVHRRAKTRYSTPCHRWFPRLPRRRRSGLVPPATMGPLFVARLTTSWSPWTPNSGIAYSVSFTDFGVFFPPASPFASTKVALTRRSLPSWRCALRSFTLHVSEPVPIRSRRPEHRSFPQDRARDSEDLATLCTG